MSHPDTGSARYDDLAESTLALRLAERLTAVMTGDKYGDQGLLGVLERIGSGDGPRQTLVGVLELLDSLDRGCLDRLRQFVELIHLPEYQCAARRWAETARSRHEQLLAKHEANKSDV